VSTGRSRFISMRPGLRLAALILVLAGLFGMHGLDGHDAVALGSVSQAATDEMPMSPAAAHPVIGSRSQPQIEALSGAGGMDMGMAAMCVAILAGALIALLRLLLGARVRPLLWVLARQARAVLRHPGRDPDLPSLIALSIQRC
jgi:Family of unknown function (DUF6153)